MMVDVIRLGNIYGFDGGSYGGNVYDKRGLSPSILTMQGGNKQPSIVVVSREEKKGKRTLCLNSKGGRGGNPNLQPSVQDRVYDSGGVSFAIATAFMPSVLVAVTENEDIPNSSKSREIPRRAAKI